MGWWGFRSRNFHPQFDLLLAHAHASTLRTILQIQYCQCCCAPVTIKIAHSSDGRPASNHSAHSAHTTISTKNGMTMMERRRHARIWSDTEIHADEGGMACMQNVMHLSSNTPQHIHLFKMHAHESDLTGGSECLAKLANMYSIHIVNSLFIPLFNYILILSHYCTVLSSFF